MSCSFPAPFLDRFISSPNMMDYADFATCLSDRVSMTVRTGHSLQAVAVSRDTAIGLFRETVHGNHIVTKIKKHGYETTMPDPEWQMTHPNYPTTVLGLFDIVRTEHTGRTSRSDLTIKLEICAGKINSILIQINE